jgi:hypothetical protein
VAAASGPCLSAYPLLPPAARQRRRRRLRLCRLRALLLAAKEML